MWEDVRVNSSVTDHLEDAGLTEPPEGFYTKLIQDKSEAEKIHTLKIILQ